MKKLMFVAALAATVSCFGDTSVASANIVGYEAIQQTNGKKFIHGCQFMNTSGESVDIQSIKFSSNGATPDDGCKISWWDLNREVKGEVVAGFVYAEWANYYYDPLDPKADEDGYVYEYGWIDSDAETRIVKSFAPGEGFFAQPSRSVPVLTVAGQVFGSENTIDVVRSIDFLQTGKKLLAANPFPTPIDIQSISFKSGSNIPDDGCKIWWWDLNREVKGEIVAGFVYAEWANYYYDPLDPKADEDGYVYEYGWIDSDAETRIIKSFNPGDGFFAQPSRSNPKLFFPNPFKTAE